jgi:hypothetical protein
MQLYFKIDTEGLLKVLDVKKQAKIVARTTNALASKARTIVKNTIYQEYNVKKKDIAVSLDKATTSRLSAILGGRVAYWRLTRFPYKITGSGVAVKSKKSGYTDIEGAFVASPRGRDWTSHGQQRQVDAKGRRFIFVSPPNKAYPLSVPDPRTYSLSVGITLASNRVQKQIVSMINSDGARTFDNELQYGLTGKYKLTGSGE